MPTAMIDPPAKSRATDVHSSVADQMAARLDAKRKATVAADIATYRTAVHAVAAVPDGEKVVITTKQQDALEEAMLRLDFTTDDFKADLVLLKRHGEIEKQTVEYGKMAVDLEVERLALKPEFADLEAKYFAARDRYFQIERIQGGLSPSMADLARFEATHRRLFMAEYKPDPHGNIVGQTMTLWGMRHLHEDGHVGGLV